MNKIRKALAGAAIAATLALTPAAAQAATFSAPSTGDHVTYYNCKGPYANTQGMPVYYCYADWDWYAEWFWHKYDGYTWVGAVWYA